MKKTPMMAQIATRKALHEAASKGRVSVISSFDALRAAAIIERQGKGKANADGGYAYGGSYGNYAVKSNSEIALRSAAIIQNGYIPAYTTARQVVENTKKAYLYTYTVGNSYGRYMDNVAALEKGTNSGGSIQYYYSGGSYGSFVSGSDSAKTSSKKEDAPEPKLEKQSFFQKYKLWIVGILAAILLYFTFRKK